MKSVLIAILFLLISCIPVKPVWTINKCETNLANKCRQVCKIYKTQVLDFSKLGNEYVCTCQKDIVATFKDSCP